MATPQLHPLEAKLYENLLSHGALNDSGSGSGNVSAIGLKVAFSGGLDSKVLLHALIKLQQACLVNNISAIHVDHQLDTFSQQWRLKCQQDCENYSIAFNSVELNHLQTNQANLEAACREGRYLAFEQHLLKNQWLLMAHHQDDQAETLLLRLLRGCGLSGAASIPEKRSLGKGLLLRPMLDLSRQQILQYAIAENLSWIEDPSNAKSDFSRNFIRNQISPLLAEKWPGYRKTLSRFTNIAREQSLLLEELADEDWQLAADIKGNLKIEIVENLSPARQKNLLYYWAKKNQLLPPSSEQIIQILKQMPAAIDGANIQVEFAGQLAQSFAGKLYLTSKSHQLKDFAVTQWLDLDRPLCLSNGIKLEVSPNQTKGLRQPRKDELVTVKARSGGERVLADYREHSTSLKKIYQELTVPPWQRKGLPLIYYGDELVAVAGVCVAKAFLVEVEKNPIKILMVADKQTL